MAAQGGASGSAPGSASGRSRGSARPTILLVDDEPDILDFIAEFLRGEGYEVVAAESARAALAAVERQPPTLLLVDARMPGMDGRQLIAELRQRPGPRLPVVLMTAGRLPAGEAAQLGIEGFLAKPFDLDDLLRCLTGVLAR